jgi:Na+/proline symporter
MRFAQFYFGLPIAMVILSIFVLPIFYRLKVYTAYEYLEQRFDLKVRRFTALLFLMGRGLAAGITIYAPAIILSVILDWNLNWTILLIGAVVILYTMFGGTTAVSQTQKQQMIIILSGIFLAFLYLVYSLPKDVSFGDTLAVAGKLGKLNIVDFEFDLSNKYNMWSAMLGGTFLFLSYFGTDQSQVQRYLSGKTLTESRLGLMFNGIFKVPMQFSILFVGIMVFMFFQFEKPPIHFNPGNVALLDGSSAYKEQLSTLQVEFDEVFEEKQGAIRQMITAMDSDNENQITTAQSRLKDLTAQDMAIRGEVDQLLQNYEAETGFKIDTEDNDYVFITYVTSYLPKGLVGLLLAVIFAAAMSSVASELSALASCTTVDFYKRSLGERRSDQHYLHATKLFTLGWGGVALLFAGTASLFENLIEYVNIVGSLFYGTILGIFVVAFFFKRIGSNATFIAGVAGELIVVTIFTLSKYGYFELAYLWLNLIGCLIVIIIAMILQGGMGKDEQLSKATS